MAVHFVLGNLKGGHPILNTNFLSQTVPHGTVFTVGDVGKNYLIIHSDEKCYVSFSVDGSDPSPASNPRFVLPAGQLFPFNVEDGTKIKTQAIV